MAAGTGKHRVRVSESPGIWLDRDLRRDHLDSRVVEVLLQISTHLLVREVGRICHIVVDVRAVTLNLVPFGLFVWNSRHHSRTVRIRLVDSGSGPVLLLNRSQMTSHSAASVDGKRLFDDLASFRSPNGVVAQIVELLDWLDLDVSRLHVVLLLSHSRVDRRGAGRQGVVLV